MSTREVWDVCARGGADVETTHGSGGGIIESEDEGNNAGLAATGLPAQRHRFSRIHDQVKILEDHDLGPLRVRKPHRLQLHFACHSL